MLEVRAAASEPNTRFWRPAPWAGCPDGDDVKIRRVSSAADPDLEAERKLTERACGGDREALGTLLRQHGPRLYRSVLLPRLGNAAAAEDALGQTYLKVVERVQSFHWQGVGFYPWLRTIGLHVAIDQLRRRKRESLFGPEDLQREIDGAALERTTPDAIEAHDLAESKKQVQRLLETIHPRYALAIRLRVLEDQPREASAQALGVSAATFDVVLHRAMAAFKKALAARTGTR
jgi:RNA polymerase sigma factor (sigma-70 family)